MVLLLDDLMPYLVAQAVGGAGTVVVAGRRPETPDACITLFEYPGMPTEHTMESGGLAYERPRIQVQCRGAAADYQGPRQTAENVLVALEKIINAEVGSNFFLRVMALQSPFELDRDANERVIIACNYQVWMRYP